MTRRQPERAPTLAGGGKGGQRQQERRDEGKSAMKPHRRRLLRVFKLPAVIANTSPWLVAVSSQKNSSSG